MIFPHCCVAALTAVTAVTDARCQISVSRDICLACNFVEKKATHLSSHMDRTCNFLEALMDGKTPAAYEAAAKSHEAADIQSFSFVVASVLTGSAVPERGICVMLFPSEQTSCFSWELLD